MSCKRADVSIEASARLSAFFFSFSLYLHPCLRRNNAHGKRKQHKRVSCLKCYQSNQSVPMHNIDICTPVILVEQCKPVPFEHRLEKVTCPKYFNGCVPRIKFTIQGCLSDLFTIMTSRSIFDQGHTPILKAPFSRRCKTILDNFNHQTTNETRNKLSNSVFFFFRTKR